MRRVVRKLRQVVKDRRNRVNAIGKTKYFCVGRNKTGTTSLKKAFEDLGYPVGRQLVAEKLADKHYFKGEFDPIIKYCESAQVFQDVPFSWPETYKHLDKAYPGSKFLLTIRDDAEQWYNSITKFHAKVFGNGDIPTSDDLRKANYVREGWMYDAVKLHGVPDDNMYHKETMINHYNYYNEGVRSYFKGREPDLLVINVSKKDGSQKFIYFLQVDSPYDAFPWENRT